MMIPQLKNQRGIALILSLIFMVTLAGIVSAYLFIASQGTKFVGIQDDEVQAFYVAEAGLEKGIYYIKYTAPDSSTDGSWRVALPGTTETPSGWNYFYTMVVDDWNLALSTNPAPFNSTATASSQQGANSPGRAIDGSLATSWRCQNGLLPSTPQWIRVNFPSGSNFTINEARFRTVNNRRPIDYQWQVSTDGISWTTVCTVTGNASTDRSDFFTDLVSPYTTTNVNFVRLYVTDAQNNSVQIRELEVHWVRVKAKCTINPGAPSEVSRYLRRCILYDGLGGSGKQIVPVSDTWEEINATIFGDSSQF